MKDTIFIKVKFCFPDTPQDTKEDFVDAIIKEAGYDEERGYACYNTQEELRESIWFDYDDNDARGYHPLPEVDKNKIEEAICSSVKKCNKELPHPKPTIFVYVFPWFPHGAMEVMKGVSGSAFWKDAMHLLISQEGYSFEEIEKTTAHEFNHTVYFNNHIPFALYENMILEGLAENFREEAVGGGFAPWSLALSDREAKKIFQSLKSCWDSTDDELRRQIFFGEGDKYKMFTGYSIGYHLVKSFRNNYSDEKWGRIMKMKPKEILDKSNFI